jgi:hypothetical protein
MASSVADSARLRLSDIATAVFVCVSTVIKRVPAQEDGARVGKAAKTTAKDAKKSPSSSSSSSSGWAVVQTWGEADRRAGVTCMDVVPTTATVLVGRRNGGMDVLRVDGTTGALRVASVLRPSRASGDTAKDESKSISSIHGIVLNGRLVVCGVEQGGRVAVYDEGLENVLGSFSCPPNVTCAAYHAPSKRLAVGCRGAELKVYTVEINEVEDEKEKEEKEKEGRGVTGVLTYSAKGGKPDKVGLCDKPWNSAVAFYQGGDDEHAGSQLVVGTGHGKLRRYDTTVGKRPQLNTPFKEHRITALAVSETDKMWWVGDAGGSLQSYDVGAGKFMGSIKGIAGSVRSVDLHPTAGVIVSGGLDRYVRVHSTRTRASVAKLYVTSQVNVVRWLGDEERTAVVGSAEPARKKKRKSRES